MALPTVEELERGLTQGLPRASIPSGSVPDISNMELPTGLGNQELVGGIKKLGAFMTTPFRGESSGGDITQDIFSFGKPKGGVPVANTTSVNNPMIDMTKDLIKNSGPAANLNDVKTRDAGVAESPTAGNSRTFTLDAFNAGQNIGGIEGGKSVSPWDEKMQSVIGRIESLAGSITPSASGYLGDTFKENYGALAQMKALKGVAELIKPLTTEGMRIPAEIIQAQKGKVLDPSQIANYVAHTNLLNKQAEALAPKPELETQKAVFKVHEDRRKSLQSLVEQNPAANINELMSRASQINPMPMQSEETDSSGIRKVTLIDGTVEYYGKDGKRLKAKGVPPKKKE